MIKEAEAGQRKAGFATSLRKQAQGAGSARSRGIGPERDALRRAQEGQEELLHVQG